MIFFLIYRTSVTDKKMKQPYHAGWRVLGFSIKLVEEPYFLTTIMT